MCHRLGPPRLYYCGGRRSAERKIEYNVRNVKNAGKYEKIIIILIKIRKHFGDERAFCSTTSVSHLPHTFFYRTLKLELSGRLIQRQSWSMNFGGPVPVSGLPHEYIARAQWIVKENANKKSPPSFDFTSIHGTSSVEWFLSLFSTRRSTTNTVCVTHKWAYFSQKRGRALQESVFCYHSSSCRHYNLKKNLFKLDLRTLRPCFIIRSAFYEIISKCEMWIKVISIHFL